MAWISDTDDGSKGLERARGLVNRYGRAATCWQVLNPGLALWLAPDGQGVGGYITYRKVHVVAGEPVCAPERLAAMGTSLCHRHAMCSAVF